MTGKALFVVIDNLAEIGSFQAGTADQSAVDFGLRHKPLDILGVHAAAVLNTDLVAGGLAVFAGNRFADHADRLIRLFIGGSQAGADGPDRFIGNHNLGNLFLGQAVQGNQRLVFNQRVLAAVEAGLKVIMCVGENKEEREAGYTDALVEYQTLIGLNGLTKEQVAKVVIAYEPVWAIGTGLTATDEQANETIGVIRKAVARKYGKATGNKIRIQYGGSMNPKNVKGLMAQPEIDGGLIGGASLKAVDFSQVVNYDK